MLDARSAALTLLAASVCGMPIFWAAENVPVVALNLNTDVSADNNVPENPPDCVRTAFSINSAGIVGVFCNVTNKEKLGTIKLAAAVPCVNSVPSSKTLTTPTLTDSADKSKVCSGFNSNLNVFEVKTFWPARAVNDSVLSSIRESIRPLSPKWRDTSLDFWRSSSSVFDFTILVSLFAAIISYSILLIVF